MVTVLVFTAPAFAISLGESDPSGPGGKNPETGADNPPPNMIGGEPRGELEDRHDPQAPEDTTGGLAADYTSFEHELGGVPDHHLTQTLAANPTDELESPGDLIQSCRGDDPHPQCNTF